MLISKHQKCVGVYVCTYVRVCRKYHLLSNIIHFIAVGLKFEYQPASEVWMEMWWHNVKISQLSNRSNLFPVYHSQMQSANHGFASKPDYLFQMCVKKGNHFSLMERNGCSKMEEWEDGVRDWWAAGRLTWEETLLMLLVAMLHAVSSTYSPVSILSTIAPFLSQNVYPIPLLFFTILVHIVTMTPFSFRHPVNLISFSSSSVHFCPPRCHLQHQAVLSIWHSEGNRQQASVCVSEMSQLKSQTWQITTAIQKWTITSERRKNYEWEVMRSSRERTFRGAFWMIWVYECVYACNVLCANAT